MLLDGKSIVITGSSRGLGRAYALAMAQEGAKIVVNGTVEADVAAVAKEIEGKGGTAVPCVASIANMDGVQRLIQTAIDSFGRIDVLINNTGNLRDRTLVRMSEEEWDSVIAVHLKGTFACSKFAASHMREQNSGSIINIVAYGGLQGIIGQTNYGAAKGGTLSMTRIWAKELARNNIRVNAVWPRARTRMTEPVIPQAIEAATKPGEAPPSPLDLGFGEPEGVAPIMIFLASDLSHGVSGQVFSLTGRKLALWAAPHEVQKWESPQDWTVEGIRDRILSAVRVTT